MTMKLWIMTESNRMVKWSRIPYDAEAIGKKMPFFEMGIYRMKSLNR